MKPGELFAFLGPNGAGKTTTIKLMCGLLFPTAGTVRIAGFDLQEQGEKASQAISYVPDQPFLYEKLTGREVLQFVADMYGMPADLGAAAHGKNDRPVRPALLRGRSHGTLLAWHEAAYCFATALLHEPKVLIVDEPTVGLDPHNIRLLKDLLRQEAEKGMTIFLSTHSLDIAEELADRIGVVAAGRLIGCGSLEHLRDQAEHGGSLEEVFLKLTREEVPQAVN